MKIFISWSGEAARVTAERTKEWLKSIFQRSIEVFVSSKDIEKGDRWAERLADVLQDYNFGIVVLNMQNKDRPWITFEAGALSKSVTKSRLVPLLCGLTPGDLLESPLGQFQGVEATRDGLVELAKAINKNLERPIEEPDLLEAFEVWWDKKGKPVSEFTDVKAGIAKKDSLPTTRDLMARIDRTESMMSEMLGSALGRIDSQIQMLRIENSKNQAGALGGILGAIPSGNTVYTYTTPPKSDAILAAEEFLKKYVDDLPKKTNKGG